MTHSSIDSLSEECLKGTWKLSTSKSVFQTALFLRRKDLQFVRASSSSWVRGNSGSGIDYSLNRKESLEGELFFQGLFTEVTEESRFKITENSLKAIFVLRQV